MEAKKKITARHIKSIYNAALVRYTNSYAQMIDDAMAGAECKAKELGVKVMICSDGGVFPMMYTYILRGVRYENIPVALVGHMLDVAQRKAK